MSKSQKNIASVTAVLALGILVAGLGFIAKKVFNEPLATSPKTESTSASSQTNTAASDTATTDTTDTKNGAAVLFLVGVQKRLNVFFFDNDKPAKRLCQNLRLTIAYHCIVNIIIFCKRPFVAFHIISHYVLSAHSEN